MTSIRPRSLAEYGAMLWRRKLLLLLVAAVMLKASFMIINGLPDVYESRASLVIASPANEDTQALGGRVAKVTHEVRSRNNLAALVQRHNLQQPGEDLDVAVRRLDKQIKLETKLRDYYPQFPEVTTITFRHHDPQTAQRVLFDLVEGFNRANETLQQEAAVESSRIRQELAEVEATLEGLSQKRALARMPAAPRSGIDPLVARANLTAAIDALTDRQYLLQQQIIEQKRQIAEQERLPKTLPPAPSVRSGSSYGVLLVRKAELEAQLKDYATQYTDKNPKVVQARTQLAEIDRQIARLESSGEADATRSASPESRELRALERELKRLETEQEVVRRDLERKRRQLSSLPAPRSTSGYGEMALAASRAAVESEAEYDRATKRYNMLLEQQEELRRGQALGTGGAPLFQLVDPPFLPQVAVAPNRPLLKLLAVAMAIGLGLLLVAALEVRNLFAIKSDRDVGYYLGVPVLAAIPETLTLVEHSRARRQRLARGLGLALLVVVLVPAFVMLLDRLQLFQLIANR